MNLLLISLTNQYLTSPITWLHTISYKNKIFFLFLYLLLLPYISYKYLIFNLFLISLIIITLELPHQTLYNILFLYFVIFIIIIYHTKFFIETVKYSVIYIFLPYKVKSFYINKKNNLRKFKIYYYLLIIPEFIIRLSLITALYYISLQLLFLTTHYEYIIIYFLQLFTQIFYCHASKFFLISSLASELLNTIIKRINITITAVKLRKINNIKPKYLFIYYLIFRIFNYILNDISYVSSVLYTREINYNNITKINIYKMEL